MFANVIIYKRQSSLTQIALICNNAAYRIENK